MADDRATLLKAAQWLAYRSGQVECPAFDLPRGRALLWAMLHPFVFWEAVGRVKALHEASEELTLIATEQPAEQSA